MKTAKMVIGIISIVLFFLIAFQSCAAGLGGALMEIDDTSGSGGILLAFLMLIAGIVGLAARNSRGGCFTAGIMYVVGALIGFANLGFFADLVIWSALALIFGIVFIIGGTKLPKKED